MAPKKNTRSHRRAADQTQTSISLSDEAMKLGKQMAADDDRSFSNFVERLIMQAARDHRESDKAPGG